MKDTRREPYPSDLSDEQWELIEDLIPKPNPHPNFPKDEYPRREIVNGILYLLRTGCPWRHLPHDLPPWTLVAHYYYAWKDKHVTSGRVKLRRSCGNARRSYRTSAKPAAPSSPSRLSPKRRHSDAHCAWSNAQQA
jgi:transposase